MKSRVVAHALVAFIGWPIFTVVASTVEAGGIPYYHLPLYQAVAGSVAGMLLLAPDFAVAATGILALSLMLFRWLGRPLGPKSPVSRLFLEPVTVFLAIFCGTCLWYPAVLSHPLLVPFWSLPSALVLGLMVLLKLFLAHDLAPPGGRLRLAASLMIIGIAVPVPSLLAGTSFRDPRPVSDLVVLGLDSLAQSDDVEAFRTWTESKHGTWYGRVVSPGLVTNAVWASVLTLQPVREHGVFHAFQRLPPGGARLVHLAKEAGYRTVAVFPDQTTSATGAEGGFDEDRSGPVGWRQLATATVQNSSVLLPLLRPHLPSAPWWLVPPNQAGTFTYDLGREIRELLTSGRAGAKTFVAAHLTYLHIATYPRLVDLTWGERRSVALTAAGSVRDRSFDWDDVDRPDDALPLRRWKVARLQSELTAALGATGFLERGGKLLVFSDHGDRVGLNRLTFTDPKYHHVIMATLGLPALREHEPTSLIDIGSLIGLVASREAADPVVEFAIGPIEHWIKLGETSRVHWSGEVDLDATLLKDIFSHLQRHRPWPSSASTSNGPRGDVAAAASLSDEPRGRKRR